MDIAKVLPHFLQDTTDRNRTSPFAFTGNKFEFRMLGSSASVADPNVYLNTAMAETLNQFSKRLENVPQESLETEIRKLIQETMANHRRVIFNGNGYTDEWVEEAEKRGLFNLISTPDALEQFVSDKNKKLLLDHKIFTEQEIYSRYEIMLENYMKTVNLEANTMIEMIQKDFLPAVVSYTEQLARTASLKKSVVPDVTLVSEEALIRKLSEAQTNLYNGIEKLKADNMAAKQVTDHLEAAKFYQSVVLKDMEDIRIYADEAEALIPEAMLPYPTYGELLFSI